ncbi:MAG TPA: lysylphosphatidylglycerol synthase domain-containing protein [Solirubrobacteraceae bacterium]|nr:lysylphosphatidylglycerol synthase domain-containing protein [Solirubrobacteraceae bacterium]
MTPAPVLASLAGTVESFLAGADDFFSHLATINWFALTLAIGFFGMYLLLRSRALFNALRAAYPDEEVPWRAVWGGYVVAYGLNSFVPASAGNVAQYYLTKNAIRNSTYPTVTTALATGAVLDACVSTLVLAFAFTQGIFPKPSDFADLGSFDIAFIGRHPELTLFVTTAIIVLGLAAIAILSARVHAFWARVRQGVTILRDRRRYLREMVTWQLGAWVFRFGTWWLMLAAFNIDASLRNVLLVQAVQVISAAIQVTPGGAGVQQALFVAVFSGIASGTAVAAYAVGQQIALSAFTLGLAFAAMTLVFRTRGFRQLLRDAKAARAAEPG